MTGPSSSRRRRLLAFGAAATVIGGTAAAATLLRSDISGAGSDDGKGSDNGSGVSPAAAAAAEPEPWTATVTRRDLARTVDVSGTLGYGEQRTVRGAPADQTTGSPGTITDLPEPGMVIAPGEPLYQVDDLAGPVVLVGDLPMWRALGSGVDDGADVAQLEQNLTDLGFADESLTVDEDFTSLTAAAVEDWQESLGLTETGRVEPGAVWFTPDDGPVRVASVTADVGDPASGDILTVTGTERLVRVDLDAENGRYAREGDTVGLELPDGTTTTGTVSDVADTATVVPGEAPGETPTTTFAVEITPDTGTDMAEVLDGSPVTVSFTTDAVTDVLAVPVETVVAAADGRYALEVVADDGTTQLVEVELGRFADGWVEVTGEIAEGDEVVSA